MQTMEAQSVEPAMLTSFKRDLADTMRSLEQNRKLFEAATSIEDQQYYYDAILDEKYLIEMIRENMGHWFPTSI